MNDKFIIKSLEIEGFRGVNKNQKISFDRPLVFFFGKNGAGKSSILGAIEWCLFGDLAYLRYSETRTKDELINQHHSTGCKVIFISQKEGKQYKFVREKKFKTKKTKFKLILPSGREFVGKEAEKECFKLLGQISFKDFSRAVYLHQESIRGLITEDPRVRDESLDRLFGLEIIRNIIEGIPIKEIEGKLEKLQQEKDKIENKIKGAIEKCGESLEKVKKEAEKDGILKKEFNFAKTCEITKIISENLINFAKEHNYPISEIQIPDSINNLNTITRKIKKSITGYREEIAETSGSDKLTKEKINLEDLKEKYKKSCGEVEDASKELKEKEKKYGNLKGINASIQKAKEEIEKLQTKRKEIDVKFRVIEDAKEYLEKTIKNICPVCDTKINRKDIIKKLSKQIDKAHMVTTKQVDDKIRNLKRKINEFSDIIDNIERAKRLSDSLVKEHNNLVKEILQTIKVKSEKEIMSYINEKIGKIKKKLRNIEEKNRKKFEILQKAEDNLEKIRSIYKVLERDEEFKEVSSTFSSDREIIKKLKEGMKEFTLLKNHLEKIMGTMVGFQERLAKEAIESSSEDISTFYRILCNHPYYSSLEINTKPKNIRGHIKNSYNIKAYEPKGKETSVDTRFSTGQMNCVALAIYLSLSKTLQHKLGFLILDDPSQNLDEIHKKALIKILKNVKNNAQIIISTHDMELQGLFKSQLEGDNYIYNLGKWTEEGLTISVSD